MKFAHLRSKLLHTITTFWPYILLFFIWCGIVLSNYQPHTTLTGWDNLHPEYAIGENIYRSFFSAWQEYQSFGLAGGMGHAADLVRQLFILPLLIFGQTNVRYILTFSCLLIGTYGVTYLSQRVLKNKRHSAAASFISGVFYMVNIGTVQNFYATFEPYYWYFCFLPWLLISIDLYFKKPSLKSAFLLFAMHFLASPLGYIQTVFITYVFVACGWMLSHIPNKKNKSNILVFCKSSLVVLLLLLISNLFWLAPVIHFTLTTVGTTISAKMNLIATPEVKLSNEYYGTFSNVLRLRGYWLELHDYRSNHFTFMMERWHTHFQLKLVDYFSYVLVLLVALGIIRYVRIKKVIIVLFCVICLLLIQQDTFFGHYVGILRNAIPLYEQIFRSPFTKWIVPLSLLSSLLIGGGTILLMELLNKIHSILAKVFATVVLAVILVVSLPVFYGNFLYPELRVKVPSEYSLLFEFFKHQPRDSRIATLPMNSFWGWGFNAWGYRGSGFLWYGIRQPIVDRAFDVWSVQSETFFLQFSTAWNSNDLATAKALIDKYDIAYFIVDESVITTKDGSTVLSLQNIENDLVKIGGKKVWQEGSLSVFEFTIGDSIMGIDSLSVGSTNTHLQRRIPSDLISNNFLNEHETFPFSNLTKEQPSNITRTASGLEIANESHIGGALKIPTLQKGDTYTTNVQLTYSNKELQIFWPDQINITNNNQDLTLPSLEKEDIPITFDSNSIIVQIGDAQIQVDKNTSVIVPITLDALQPITITLTSPELIVSNSSQGQLLANDVESHDLSPAIWHEFLEEKSIPITPGEIKIVLSTKPSTIPLVGINVNCDVLKRGTANATFTSDNIYLESNFFGTNCVSLQQEILGAKGSYVLHVSGTHTSGRNLKFYVQHPVSEQTVLESIVSGEKFSNYFSIFGSEIPSNQALYLTFENKSFGQKTVNQINSINVFPVPLTYLSNIYVETFNKNDVTNPVFFDYKQKIGTFSYIDKIQLKNAPGYIALSQAYHPAWLALARPSNTNALNLKQYHLLPHYQFNGWANAWEVPAGEYEIIVFYWPQFLSFAGYGLLLSTFSYFGFYGVKHIVRSLSARRTTLRE